MSQNNSNPCIIKDLKNFEAESESSKFTLNFTSATLTQCKNGCLGITMNRDDNASKNILDIFLYYLM